VVLRLPDGLAESDPVETALASRLGDVLLTLLGGREVYRRAGK
jgi:hypothetical protein